MWLSLKRLDLGFFLLILTSSLLLDETATGMLQRVYV